MPACELLATRGILEHSMITPEAIFYCNRDHQSIVDGLARQRVRDKTYSVGRVRYLQASLPRRSFGRVQLCISCH
jgi:hypothetical protein